MIKRPVPRRLNKIPLPRMDDPAGVMKHSNRYAGGTALIVLGGASAAGWERLSAEIKPDVILGANGVNSVVPNLNYWICSENMHYTYNLTINKDPRAMELMEMFHRESGAKTKLVSHRSWDLLRSTDRCISIRRTGYEPDQVPADFSYRVYGEGFMSGWVYSDTRYMCMKQRVGNAGCQLLHMAGVLGCDEVHTIGFDMTFQSAEHHHFYNYPIYKADHFRNPENFVQYKGANTQMIWLACAEFMQSMEPYIERAGIDWHDHSHGLFELMGMECAK